MEEDDTLCFCFHVSRQKIENFIRRTRARRASQISECFGAGTGCGWCIPYLVQLYRDLMDEEKLNAKTAAERELPAEEYEALRLFYLQEIRAGSRSRNQIGGEPAPASDPLDPDLS